MTPERFAIPYRIGLAFGALSGSRQTQSLGPDQCSPAMPSDEATFFHVSPSLRIEEKATPTAPGKLAACVREEVARWPAARGYGSPADLRGGGKEKALLGTQPSLRNLKALRVVVRKRHYGSRRIAPNVLRICVYRKKRKRVELSNGQTIDSRDPSQRGGAGHLRSPLKP